MLKKYKDNLTKLGLTEKESQVYLSLIALGTATADQVSKDAKLNRSTTYVQIEQLMNQGLVSTFKKGKKTFFTAESPLNLERLLEKRERDLEQMQAEAKVLLPELTNIYATAGTSRPVVRAFEGKDGLMSMRDQILESGVTEMYVATDYDKFTDIFTTEELLRYSKKRAKKKIKSYLLYTKDSAGDLEPIGKQEFKRVTTSKFPFGSEVYIYGNSVAFTSIDDGITGIVVTSTSLSQTMKALYWQAWGSA